MQSNGNPEISRGFTWRVIIYT